MKKLNRTIKTLLISAVRTCGSFKPEDVLPHIEEQITMAEYETLQGFLAWVMEKGKTFGHNVDTVFAEYIASRSKIAVANIAQAMKEGAYTLKNAEKVFKPKRFKFKPDRNIDETVGFTNGQRAERGEQSVRVHPDFDSNDTQTAVVDALTDIFHFCDREGVDLETALQFAKGNWEQER